MSSTGRRNSSRLAKVPPPNAVRHFRRKAALARAEVGRRLGVSGETIRKLEQCDIWLDADRARELGRVLGVPYELLGFSYAHDAYAWAAKALPVVGTITEGDEIRFTETGRDIAGGAHLPAGCVALEIAVGKMRGWHLVYQEREQHTMSRDILASQGQSERYLVHLINGTTWWRHIQPASTRDLYHLSSRHLDTINDVRVAWVSRVTGFVCAEYALPTRIELDASGTSNRPK